MMLNSLLKLLTISVSKMLLEDGRVWEFLALFLSDFLGMGWEKIVFKCYCYNNVAIFALLFLTTFIIMSDNYYVKYSHIRIYQSSFLQDGFAVLAYVKDDDGKKNIIRHFIKII